MPAIGATTTGGGWRSTIGGGGATNSVAFALRLGGDAAASLRFSAFLGAGTGSGLGGGESGRTEITLRSSTTRRWKSTPSPITSP